MTLSSKYYNTIEMEDKEFDQSLQSVRKHNSSGIDPDLNKNLSEKPIKRFMQEIK